MYRDDVPRSLGKEVAYKLDESHRSWNPTLSWQRAREDMGYCYVVWGPGDYDALERAHKEKKLTYAHEVIRQYARVAFDIDLEGELMSRAPPRDELLSLVETVVRRVLSLYYEAATVSEELLRFVWLDGSREGKLSLHLVVNGAVFYHRDIGRRQQLKEFYDLFEREALHSGLFGSFPVSKLFDRGLETGVQLRMLGARKHDASSVPLRLPKPEGGCELHRTLVSMWRNEDRDEFFRHLRLNDRGKSVLAPPPRAGVARLGRMERWWRTCLRSSTRSSTRPSRTRKAAGVCA